MTEENKDTEIPKLEKVKDDIPLFLKIIMAVGIVNWFGIIVDIIIKLIFSLR